MSERLEGETKKEYWNRKTQENRLDRIAEDYYALSDSLYTVEEVKKMFRDTHKKGGNQYIKALDKDADFYSTDWKDDWAGRAHYIPAGQTWGIPPVGYEDRDEERWYIADTADPDSVVTQLTYPKYRAEFGGHGMFQYALENLTTEQKDSIMNLGVHDHDKHGDAGAGGRGGHGKYGYGIEKSAHGDPDTDDTGNEGKLDDYYTNYLRTTFGPREK